MMFLRGFLEHENTSEHEIPISLYIIIFYYLLLFFTKYIG